MITATAIWLLLIDSAVISLMITEYIMDWNILPPEIEGFAWAIAISFQAIVSIFLVTALLTELRNFNNSMIEILTHLRASKKEQ